MLCRLPQMDSDAGSCALVMPAPLQFSHADPPEHEQDPNVPEMLTEAGHARI
jgi:hypothetical protein